MEQNPSGQGEQNQPQQPVQPSAGGQPPVGQQPPQKSKSNAVVIIIVVIVVLLVVGLIGGYFVFRSIKARVSQKIGQTIGENMLEKAIEQGTGQKADVSADGNNVSIKTDSGTFSASETGTIKLPSDFPSDVFVPSDAKITFATSTPANLADGTKASFSVGYAVNQSVDSVANKYRDEMAKNGWTKDTEANYGAMMISFKKGTREVLVTVSDSQGSEIGATGVSLAVSEN
ncbi:MAG: hypothetical protein PHP25_02185 [Candidatus Moranbacteria bacterium]|nr:hypothetical protein [Candidatus Moranbacteria bacterium]